jgi:hypothetical protein
VKQQNKPSRLYTHPKKDPVPKYEPQKRIDSKKDKADTNTKQKISKSKPAQEEVPNLRDDEPSKLKEPVIKPHVPPCPASQATGLNNTSSYCPPEKPPPKVFTFAVHIFFTYRDN